MPLMTVPATRVTQRRAFLMGFVAASLAGVGRCLAADAPASVGRVARAVGPVAVERGAGSTPAVPGLDLRGGDRIVTGAAGRIEIACVDGSSLVIGESSRVVLTQFIVHEAPGRHAVIDLLQGILRLALKPGLGWYSFEVRTPTAVASVRSTEWIVESAANGTGVFVVTGAVEVWDSGNRGLVILAPGQGSDVRPGAPPTAPATWGRPRADSALARTRLP